MPATDSPKALELQATSPSRGPDLSYEQTAWASGAKCVAGVDEVGRGPVAGPVVAAAVILDPAHAPDGLNDSKKLSEGTRERLFAELMRTCTFAFASLPAQDIDRINIRRASLLAMAQAVQSLPVSADHVLVDGRDIPPGLTCSTQAIIKGDSHSLSIAAASVIAKVIRDRMMKRAADRWTAYGLASHKGYPSAAHRMAIEQNGPCALHRMTFAPLRAK